LLIASRSTDSPAAAGWAPYTAPETATAARSSPSNPVFPPVEVTPPGRQSFRITAREVAPRSFYIQSATLNGRELASPWLSVDSVTHGGECVLDMAATANTSFGSVPQNRPQAMIPWIGEFL
jgi:putative alpha-1,2-mannosidase